MQCECSLPVPKISFVVEWKYARHSLVGEASWFWGRQITSCLDKLFCTSKILILFRTHIKFTMILCAYMTIGKVEICYYCPFITSFGCCLGDSLLLLNFHIVCPLCPLAGHIIFYLRHLSPLLSPTWNHPWSHPWNHPLPGTPPCHFGRWHHCCGKRDLQLIIHVVLAFWWAGTCSCGC